MNLSLAFSVKPPRAIADLLVKDSKSALKSKFKLTNRLIYFQLVANSGPDFPGLGSGQWTGQKFVAIFELTERKQANRTEILEHRNR